MSRLYIVHKSDRGDSHPRGTKHCCNEFASVKILWGSRDNSNLAIHASVDYTRDMDKPKVFLTVPIDLEMILRRT